MLEGARRARALPLEDGMSVLLNNIFESHKGEKKMSPRPAVSYAAACLLAADPSLAFAQLNTNTSSATANSTTGSTITTVTSAATKPTTHVIEWDLTSMPDQLDGNPGAMVVDTR